MTTNRILSIIRPIELATLLQRSEPGRGFFKRKCMAKPFIDIQGQIQQLIDRGLIIRDQLYAKDCLTNEVNYYKLNGYFHLFYSKPDVFEKNITFENIMEIYHFDLYLKNLILFYSSIIEISFKNYVSYIHTKKYGTLGYLNAANFNEPSKQYDFISKAYSSISLNDKQNFIRHHTLKCNSEFPLWVLMEIVSFGNISKFYKNMLKADKIELCKTYYQYKWKYVENWIRCVVTIRNYSAHNMKLFNTNFTEYVCLYSQEKTKVVNNKLFAFILIIYRLLPEEYREKYKNSLSKIIEQYPFAKQRIDFPNDWQNLFDNGS